VTYLAVLEAQRQALNAESQYLSVRRQRLDARIDLHLALGGDWGARPADPAVAPLIDTALPGADPLSGETRP
jgi:outer membrane protein TolC